MTSEAAQASEVLYLGGDGSVPDGLYARLLEASSALIVLDVVDCKPVIDHLRMLARRQGQSIYSWSSQHGLASLREAGIAVPGSQRPADALRYVLQSNHFGIYLFPEVTANIYGQFGPQLRQVARALPGVDRKVVLMGSQIRLPAGLDALCSHLTLATRTAPRLRLRDGRWVI
ncbi:MAG: hypothetical protein KDI37_10495 [Xanthomonadales bacterium]|nr:hypothetical protein [Xanthomonadales bacterium]MCB1642151.1 hypothetical protein [Xanthomonadales bacterium]